MKKQIKSTISFYCVGYGINLQSCFSKTQSELNDKFDLEEVKSIILSIYDVPVLFQLNSQVEGKLLKKLVF